MAYFKLMNQSYDRDGTVERLCAYILNYEKTRGVFGGLNIRPETAALEIETVQRIWEKQDGRLMRHFILSFSDAESICVHEALEIGYQAAAYYASDYQIIFGVHIPQDVNGHLHIHFGMNAVSFQNGKKYSGAFEDYHRLQGHIDHILRRYDCKLIHSDMPG